MNSELGLKAPKRPVIVEFPVTKTAARKQFGWKLRAANPQPDYVSRCGRVRRWRNMPECDKLVDFALVKPAGGTWAEIAVVPLRERITNVILTGPQDRLLALVRKFIACASTIPYRGEERWLRHEWGKAVTP